MAGKSIVIIEDNKTQAKILKDVLMGEGFVAHVANDGEEGINLVKTIKPDLVLLDIMLPKINGIDVLKTLKGDKETRHISVMLLTNQSEGKYISEATELGVIGFLVKSNWDINQVARKVKSILEE